MAPLLLLLPQLPQRWTAHAAAPRRRLACAPLPRGHDAHRCGEASSFEYNVQCVMRPLVLDLACRACICSGPLSTATPQQREHASADTPRPYPGSDLAFYCCALPVTVTHLTAHSLQYTHQPTHQAGSSVFVRTPSHRPEPKRPDCTPTHSVYTHVCGQATTLNPTTPTARVYIHMCTQPCLSTYSEPK